MTRHFLVSIAVVSVLAAIPDAVIAQKETPKTVAAPESNQVYVKIIMPTDSADRDRDRSVGESWIAEDLKKRGQSKFTAVTEWVPLDLSPLEATHVWDGAKLGEILYCPVGADIPDRAKGRIKVTFPASMLFEPKSSPVSGGCAMPAPSRPYLPVGDVVSWTTTIPFTVAEQRSRYPLVLAGTASSVTVTGHACAVA
jgi:hypothetical protein